MAGERYFPPVIQSPVEGAQYLKRFDTLADSEQQVKLQVAVTNRVKSVQWFIDNKLFATSQTPYALLYFSPLPGSYDISVVDDTGGTDSVTLVVEDYRLH